MLAKALGQQANPTAITEKRDLLERLLARLAHEVRNPLGSLGIHFQLLEEDLWGADEVIRGKVGPRLEIIRGELHRLERVVEHFLRLAAPSDLDLEEVDIREMLTHVTELLRPEATSRRILLETVIEPGLPRVVADPVRLSQALLNLVINAVQAVEQSGRIEVSASWNAPDELLLRVRDTGPGLPQGSFAALFDPYFTTKPEGNGLGLWIAQQIVVAHGGELKAENAPGGGAEFTVRLPQPKTRTVKPQHD